MNERHCFLCHLIEWRADSDPSGIADLEEVLQEKDFYLDFLKILDDLEYIADKPLIFTMRSVQQGGMLQLLQMQKAEDLSAGGPIRTGGTDRCGASGVSTDG